jgi:hypothetical protein
MAFGPPFRGQGHESQVVAPAVRADQESISGRAFAAPPDATALPTPLMWSYYSGHFRSGLKAPAVTRSGKPLPWYSYPCIDFLKRRKFHDKTVLEFGGGQSSLWWAARAKSVVTIEGDPKWFSSLRERTPSNVRLFLVSVDSAQECVDDVNRILQSEGFDKFDVTVIDGLYRRELVDTAMKMTLENGVIVCDDSEGFGLQEEFATRGLSRVDFWGQSPGVILPHCTSLYFGMDCFLFSANQPMDDDPDAG